MLLYFELVLTLWACIRLNQAKKCWIFGFIPVFAGVFLTLIVAIIIEIMGGIPNPVSLPFLLIDLAVVISLVWIIIFNKKSVYKPVSRKEK